MAVPFVAIFIDNFMTQKSPTKKYIYIWTLHTCIMFLQNKSYTPLSSQVVFLFSGLFQIDFPISEIVFETNQ